MLIKGLTPEVIDSEFSEDDRAWVVSEEGTDSLLVVPDPRYAEPVVQFFMKLEDAQQYALDVKEENENLKDKNLQPKSIKLKETMRAVMGAEPPCAVILHSPNAMYEYFRDRGEG